LRSLLLFAPQDGRNTGVPNPKFAHGAATPERTSGSKGHQQTYDSSAAFRFEIPGIDSQQVVQEFQIGGTGG
jgi:hypothetical protein